MNVRTSTRLAVVLTFCIAGAVAALLVAGVVSGQEPVGADLVAGLLFVVGLPAIAQLGSTIVRRTGNAIGWMFVVMPLAGAVAFGTEAYVMAGYHPPDSLPGVSYAAWLSQLALMGVVLPIPLLFLLFPTGHPLSPRWRWAVRGWQVGTVLTLLWAAFRDGEVYGSPSDAYPGIDNPLAIPGFDSVEGAVLNLGVALVLLSAVLGISSLVLRFFRAKGDERQQLRWILLVAVVSALLFLALLVKDALGLEGNAISDGMWAAMVIVLLLGLPAAVAVAILKYRLYDVDVVISKTLVYGSLAVFITLVYAGIVVGVGSLVGSGDEPNLALQVLATAIVAVAFQPVRERASRFANRLVYGKRATPYEVLTEFAERVGETYASEDVLARMARVLGEGTGADTATVWLRIGDEYRHEATWPDDTDTPVSVPDDAVEVRHQGEVLGALSAVMPASDPMNPAKEKLIADLAAQAGLVLRNVKLIEELRASRQRLVTAQDEERRRLERNIHDGAQQQLVALQVKQRLVEQFVERDPTKARELLESLQLETASALDDLRDLARGIYPPLLADKGLTAALEAQSRRSPVPVKVHGDGIGRYREDVEAAVYFCTLEALNNVAKYAEASHATIELEQSDGRLTFSVRDDGGGFDPSATGYGTGLQGMADRLDAIGGSLRVTSARGAGTTIEGSVPVEAP